ncbi:hypothetical protein TNCV_4330781 [Trichonephila clavipes]|nr:hypothetical protein TNCV_4330781 [Trichonephila clavipes]
MYSAFVARRHSKHSTSHKFSCKIDRKDREMGAPNHQQGVLIQYWEEPSAIVLSLKLRLSRGVHLASYHDEFRRPRGYGAATMHYLFYK